MLLLLMPHLKILVSAINSENVWLPILGLIQCFFTWNYLKVVKLFLGNCMDTFLNMLNLRNSACCSLDRLSSPSCFDVFSRDEESKRNNLVLLRFLIIARLYAISVKYYTKPTPFNGEKEFLYRLKIFTWLLFTFHSSYPN